ncbi:MAG: hypothetical protein ABIA67_05840 [Candidatus Margulisiibacteriota bacterium]
MKHVAVPLVAKKPLNTPFAPVLHMSGRNSGLAQRSGHYGDASSVRIRETKGRQFQPRYLQNEEKIKPFTSLKNTPTNYTFSAESIIPKNVEPVLVRARAVKPEKKEAKEQQEIHSEETGNLRRLASWPLTKIFLLITTVAFAFASWACTTVNSAAGIGAQKPVVAEDTGKAQAESKNEFGFVQYKTTIEEARKVLEAHGYIIKEKKALVNGYSDEFRTIYADKLPTLFVFKNSSYLGPFFFGNLKDIPEFDQKKLEGLEIMHIYSKSPSSLNGFFFIANDYDCIIYIDLYDRSGTYPVWRLTDILEPCDLVNGKVVIANPILEVCNDGKGFYLYQEGWEYAYVWGIDGQFKGMTRVKPAKEPAISKNLSLKQD